MKLLNYLRKIYGENTLKLIDIPAEKIDIMDIIPLPILEEINSFVIDGSFDSIPLKQLDHDYITLAKEDVPELERTTVNSKFSSHEYFVVNEKMYLNLIGLLKNAERQEIYNMIEKNVVDMMFELGWKNHINAFTNTGALFNIGKPDSEYKTPEFFDGVGNISLPYDQICNDDYKERKILTYILAASNYIMSTQQLGGHKFVIMNPVLISRIINMENFNYMPSSNRPSTTMVYPMGSLCGMTIYANPWMSINDNRIVIGTCSKNAPGIYGFFDSEFSQKRKKHRLTTDYYYKLTTDGICPELSYLTMYVDL